MPSKFYGIAAAGRPTYFIGAEHGEIGRILEENGCGFTVTPGDGEVLTELDPALAGDRDLWASLGGPVWPSSVSGFAAGRGSSPSRLATKHPADETDGPML